VVTFESRDPPVQFQKAESPEPRKTKGGELFRTNPHMLCKDKDALARSTGGRDFPRQEKDHSEPIGHSNCTVWFQEAPSG
jgi:hypothetical protein